MSEMLIHNTQHTVFYIDPTLSDEVGEGGDGSSAATAARHFPSTLTDNTVYLVRRSAVGLFADLPTKSDADVAFTMKSLVIMGMPQQSDEMYSKVPSDAQLAWVDVDKTSAYIRQPYAGYRKFSINGCRNFLMRGIVYMSKLQEDRRHVSMGVHGADRFGCVARIEKCRFRAAEFEFTDPADTTTKNNHYGTWYLAFNTDLSDNSWSSMITFDDVVVDHWGTGYAFDLGRVNEIRTTNIVVNRAQCDSGEPTFMHRVGYIPNGRNRVLPILRLKNLTVKYYYTDSNGDNRLHSIFRGDYAYIEADTIAISIPSQTRKPYRNQAVTSPVIDGTVYSPGTIIQNVTATLADLPGRRDELLKITMGGSDAPYKNGPYGQYIIVKHVNASFATNYPPKYYNNDGSNWEQNLSNNDVAVVRVTVDETTARTASNDILLQDINITAPMGMALIATGALVDLNSCSIQGTCAFRSCMGKIGSISTWYPGYAIKDSGSNTLYIGTITCNRANPKWEYNSQVAMPISGRSFILCGSTNIQFVDTKFTNIEQNLCSYICSSNIASGNYTVRSSAALAETWSVNRTGSAAGCSLKLSNNSANDRATPLQIGGEPFKGITMHATAGDHVASIYMTLYGYNDPNDIMHRFNVRVLLPNGDRVFSEEGNWSLDTNSVWNDIEGSTSYLLQIPFHLDAEGDVEFIYTFSWFMANAATYVDPYPAIS